MENIYILSEAKISQLLPEIRASNEKLYIGIVLESYNGTKKKFALKHSFVSQTRTALRTKTLEKVYISVDNPKKLILLQCFVHSKPKTFTLILRPGSKKFKAKDCEHIFQLIRSIQPKFLSLTFTLGCGTIKFMKKLNEEISKSNKNKLKLLNFVIDVEEGKFIHTSGVNSIEWLDCLMNFSLISFTLDIKKIPKSFKFKLVYFNCQKLDLEFKGSEMCLAFNLIIKNTSKMCFIQLRDIYTVKSLLPLFLLGTEKHILRIAKPRKLLRRYETKLILKYQQHFSFYKLSPDEASTLPLNKEEVEYLERIKRLLLDNYNP